MNPNLSTLTRAVRNHNCKKPLPSPLDAAVVLLCLVLTFVAEALDSQAHSSLLPGLVPLMDDIQDDPSQKVGIVNKQPKYRSTAI